MNLDKLTDTENLTLSRGSHIHKNEGTCVMEAVAWLAGEPHSDKPQCTNFFIRNLMIEWNDSLPSDGMRNKVLGPLLIHVVGTNQPQFDFERSFILIDAMIREMIPFRLRTMKNYTFAEVLRRLPPIVDNYTRHHAQIELGNLSRLVNNSSTTFALLQKGYALTFAHNPTVSDAKLSHDVNCCCGIFPSTPHRILTEGEVNLDEYNSIMTDLVMKLCLLSDGFNPERDLLLSYSKKVKSHNELLTA